jgi:hypothetical protein
MAITFDAASNSRTNGTTSQSHSHTCTGSDRALVVGVVGAVSDNITAATYNGVAMTLISKSDIGSSRFCYLYYLGNPASGSNTIQVTASSSSHVEIDAASYRGVSQTSQPEAFQVTTGSPAATTMNSSVTTVTDNSWVIGIALGMAGTITAGANTVVRTSNLLGAIIDSAAPVTPAGARTLTHNMPSSNGMGAILLALAPSVGGGGPVLTTPVGTSTGTTTATVGATTDTGNGTLYAVVTTSATQPSIAQIKAGQNHLGSSAAYASSQAVSSTGAKTFSATGLSAATTYYAHLVQTSSGAVDSNVISSSSFTTSAAAATAVTISGPSGGLVNVASTNFTVGANGTITGTVTVTPAPSADGTFSPTSVNISSGTPTATFTFTPNSTGAKNITVTNNGGLSNPAAHVYTVTSLPTVSCTLKNNTGTLIASTVIPKVVVLRLSDASTILNLTSQTTTAGGILNIANASLVAGTDYLVVCSDSTGTNVGVQKGTAA